MDLFDKPKIKLANELINFIDNSPSSVHGIENIKKLLESKGFKFLDYRDKWNIKKGARYFTIKNNSALVAFEIGTGNIEDYGFRLIGAHIDSPGFIIKPASEIIKEGCYVTINTEVYGGVILNTWFDRPLTIAGRVIIRGKSIMKPVQKLIWIKRPILIIPSLAIHMNMKINEGYKFNKQVDMLPILGFVSGQLDNNEYLLNLLSTELSVDKYDILDYELFVLPYEKGCIMGYNNEFISSARLDDLWMIFSGIKALINSNTNKATKLMVCFNNEEIGSLTSEGADSNFLLNILERINVCIGNNLEDLQRGFANSVMISADLAHGVHPNYPDKHDPTNRPKLGHGPVIKYSASKKYATTSIAASIIKECCNKTNVPFQTFVNRSDILGGTTIGPVINSKLTVPIADVGTPILSMHSCRELGAVDDNVYIFELFKVFFEI